MYSIRNKKDIEKIKKYHRAKDMLNIKDFFKDLSPVTDLVIILDEDDYNNNKDKLKDFKYMRNGNPITEPCMPSVPVRGITQSPVEIIRKIKEINPKGVLILFQVDEEPEERYERLAGISIGISLGNMIYIEAVGKGFDGREVQKGMSCHERYIIPWKDIILVNIDNFQNYNTFIIDNEGYKKSRKERIEYLISCGFAKKVVEQKVPKKYRRIPNSVWKDIIKNVIKILLKEESYLRNRGILEFIISGNTSKEKFKPWQMADDQRLG